MMYFYFTLCYIGSSLVYCEQLNSIQHRLSKYSNKNFEQKKSPLIWGKNRKENKIPLQEFSNSKLKSLSKTWVRVGYAPTSHNKDLFVQRIYIFLSSVNKMIPPLSSNPLGNIKATYKKVTAENFPLNWHEIHNKTMFQKKGITRRSIAGGGGGGAYPVRSD